MGAYTKEKLRIQALTHLAKIYQTPELCLELVQINGLALRLVNRQTDEICLEAVKQNGLALEHVKNQTNEICLEAVKQYGCALHFVWNQTDEICLEAVKNYGSVLRLVHNQTDEICLAAISQNPYALTYVKNLTKEILLCAISKDIRMVNFIRVDILPVSEWDIRWFKHLTNVELSRAFIKERGKEVVDQLKDRKVLEENNEYRLIQFHYSNPQRGWANTDHQRALVYNCPSSNDTYFTIVEPSCKTIKSALSFLNNGLGKDVLAYES